MQRNAFIANNLFNRLIKRLPHWMIFLSLSMKPSYRLQKRDTHLMHLKRRKLILIGCGPHYQEKYHCVLEQHGVTITLLIDLKSNQEAIIHFFQGKTLKPLQMLFLEEHFRNHITPQEIDAFVTRSVDLSTVDGVMICTEP